MLLRRIALENSAATVEADREAIFAQVRASIGFTELNVRVKRAALAACRASELPAYVGAVYRDVARATVDVDRQEPQRRQSALHQLARLGRENEARFLINEAGANVNIGDAEVL